jgi:hypothetical protein
MWLPPVTSSSEHGPFVDDLPMKLVIFLSSVLLGIHTIRLLYFWYVSWAFPSRGESPIYMHTHLSYYRHLHMSFFRDFEHHLQVSVGRLSPTLGWCLIRMFTTPCTYEMDRTSIHGKKPAALSVFSDELGCWDSQNSLWTAAIWAAQVTAFCLWRMSILAAFFFPPQECLLIKGHSSHPLPLRSFPLSPRAVSQVHSWGSTFGDF